MSLVSRSVVRFALRALPLALLAPLAAGQGAPLAAAALPALPTAQEVRDTLALSDWTVQTLQLPATAGVPFQASVTIAGMPVELALVPHSVLAPGFRLLEQLADGSIHEVVPAAPTTYQGVVHGFPDSLVAGALVDGQFTGLVRLAPGERLWGIQPATDADAQAPRTSHIVYDSGRTELPGIRCGTPDGLARGHALPTSPGDAGGVKVAQIACDADFEFYTLNGSSTPGTQTDITNVINAVSAIYHADVGIDYAITQILVRTAEPDPFTSTNPNTLLSQFTNDWNANHAGVTRDVAHLFTGKNVDGSVIGIAQLSVICNLFNAYGLVQSRYTNNFTFRTGLSAHELGHNWSAQHCDGDPACSIMCSGLGGCSGNVTSFNAGSKTQIQNFKAAVTCLTDAVPPAPPVISNVTPASVKALTGTAMTVTGTLFSTASTVMCGGQSVLFTLVDDTQITFFTPNALALGATGVTVTTEGGTSNTKTYTTVETLPTQLLAPVIAFSFAPFTWTYGGAANKLASLLINLSGTTFPYQSQNILLWDLILQQAFTNAAGIGTASLPGLPPAAVGLTFFSQIVTVSGGVVSASNITSTLIGA